MKRKEGRKRDCLFEDLLTSGGSFQESFKAFWQQDDQFLTNPFVLTILIFQFEIFLNYLFLMLLNFV